MLSVQGCVEPARLEKCRVLPPEDPHYMNEERYRQRLAWQGRPKEKDLRSAADFVLSALPGQGV